MAIKGSTATVTQGLSTLQLPICTIDGSKNIMVDGYTYVPLPEYQKLKEAAQMAIDSTAFGGTAPKPKKRWWKFLLLGGE